VNHMEGHIMSVLYKNTDPIGFPLLALLISGGHTQLLLATKWGDYELLGETQDDAVGEAFDKVARMLELPYPGGPEISRLANEARQANLANKFNLPKPMIDSQDYNFSFSGLKTSVLYKIKKLKELTRALKQVLSMKFENAVSEILIAKTRRALLEYQPKTLVVAGGVIANTYLRGEFEKLVAAYSDVSLRIPEKELSTDNAIMIGVAGYLNTLTRTQTRDITSLRAIGNLDITSTK